jgi:hypothetical protein
LVEALEQTGKIPVQEFADQRRKLVPESLEVAGFGQGIAFWSFQAEVLLDECQGLIYFVRFLHLEFMMIRLLCTTLLCLLVFPISKAQNFTGHIKAGLNISQIDGDAIEGFNKPGLKAGAGVSFQLVEDVFICGELEYTQKGSRNGENDPIYQWIRLSYLQMPIHFRYEFLGLGLAEAGFYFGRILTAKADDGSGFQDQIEFFQPFEYGFSLGVGYSGLGRLVPMVHFERSLASINQNSSYLNRLISFSVRYLF